MALWLRGLMAPFEGRSPLHSKALAGTCSGGQSSFLIAHQLALPWQPPARPRPLFAAIGTSPLPTRNLLPFRGILFSSQPGPSAQDLACLQ